MASEYLMKLAREQALPEEKRELTRAEKRANWWHYHKLYVIAGVVALAVLAGFIWDFCVRKEPAPDYQIAYIGSTYLPEDTTAALETALEELCDDRNQDGQVMVKVRAYPLYADESAGYQTTVAAQVQLSVDISDYESLIYLMEDPAAFQRDFELLARPDGSVPEPEETEGIWFAWSDCPVLACLELGSYTEYTMSGTITGDNQEVYSQMYIARRAVFEDGGDQSGAIALWEKLITGAVE